MKNNIFIGPFKNELFDYYNYKINLGYSFKYQLNKLKFFDKFTYTHYNDEKKISQEIIYKFIEQTNTNKNSKSAYASLLRQFALYLSKNGIEAYVIPTRLYSRGNRHIAYIFTEDEILRIFKSLENYNFKNQFRKDTMIILFKLLYCTGMRISEALNICIKDINFEEKIITIHKTKNNVERIIGLNDTLCEELNVLVTKYSINEYIFVRTNGKKYNSHDINALFRKILYYAKIKHTQKGPRLHDLRFTFCTRCLRKLVEENKDINSYIPVLSAYMGHKNFKSTEYYLTLTFEVYPNIRNKIEEHSKNVIRNIDWGGLDE